MTVRRNSPVAPRPEVSGPVETKAPRQLVTEGSQPKSRADVFITGTGPGWADPAPAKAHRTTPVSTYTGPLFKDEPSPNDVQQGQLGDCYFCAGMASLAAANPQVIKDLIKPMGDGSVEVTFHERDAVTGAFRPVTIRVDTELYESRFSGVLYGHSPGDKATMELWFPLVEKAYAAWRGGYETVGLGGVQNQIFEAVMGRPAGWLGLTEASEPDAVWGTIQATLNAKLPLGAATFSTDDGRYANTGVHANHGYSVLKTEEVGGERFVVLRNPWGSGEPRNNGADDGVFKLKLADFMKLYGQLQFSLI